MFLNCHTSFSFKFGTLSPQNLFNEARRCGVRKLVLTEINNTSSYIEMVRLCEENKAEYELEIALGIEFRKGNKLLYIALAQNNKGFEEINRFLSYHNTENIPLPDRAPELEHAFIIYPLFNAAELLRDNEFVGIRLQELTKPASRSFPSEKLIAWHPVTFGPPKTDYNIHRLLRAIDNNTLLSKLPLHEQAHPNEVMMPEQELRNYYRNYPQLLHNTQGLLEKCHIDVSLGTDKNKKTFTGRETDDWDFLVGRSWEGFGNRYDSSNPVMRERFNRELEIIRQKNGGDVAA